MQQFEPYRYLKKYAALIILLLAVAVVGLYVVLSRMQEHVASIVINYNYSDAQYGLAPDGNKLDVSEIYSPDVISTAINNLNLDPVDFSIDVIRSSITVTQIEDESITAVNEALNKEGETSDLQPTKYLVSYTVGSDVGENLARAILDEIVNAYFARFSEMYVNSTSVTNTTNMVTSSSYDYIEQIDIISESVETIITNLESLATNEEAFRSSASGYCFDDLLQDYRLLYNTEITPVNAYILNHRVTKDSNVLITKYNQKVQDAGLEQQQYDERIKEVEGIIEDYVLKLRESGNTADDTTITVEGGATLNSNVIGEVVSPNYYSEDDEYVTYDQTTEYEILLQNWIDIYDSYYQSIMDAAYNQYVVDCFSGNNDAVVNYQQSLAYIAEQRDELTEELSEELSGELSEEDIAALEAQLEESESTFSLDTISGTQADTLSNDLYSRPTKECTQDGNIILCAFFCGSGIEII